MEPDQLSSRAQLFNPVKKFRLRGFILVLFTCILACVFAADSNMALSDLDKLAGVITPLGELRLGAISIVLAVTEMMVQDVPTTWSNSSVIYTVFQGGFNYFTTMLNAVIYPSEDSGGLADFTPAMYALWAHPSCLAQNVTVCETPTYNYDVGFTPGAAQNGLGLLVEEYRIAASEISALATNGVLDANDPSALFIIAANRDFLAGGLVKLTDYGIDTLNQAITDNRTNLFLILSKQLIIAILGYIFVFHAMSRWYRDRDDATNLLLMILPPSAMKSDQELENVVRTGIIVDKADVSVRSLLQTKISRSRSAIGSLFDTSRRGSPGITSGDPPKDEKSLVQVEAKLKKLQFEQARAENQSPSSDENWLAPSMARRISDAQAHHPLRSNPSLILSSVVADGE